jgi:hypothetical protein
MEEGKEFSVNETKVERDEVFSKSVRAGKRTYFFDVKATKRDEYYLTITESKKRFNKEGRPFYEKHKVFLYKEDFEKFQEGFEEVLEFIQNSNNQPTPRITSDENVDQLKEKDYTDIDFDDLEVEVSATQKVAEE